VSTDLLVSGPADEMVVVAADADCALPIAMIEASRKTTASSRNGRRTARVDMIPPKVCM